MSTYLGNQLLSGVATNTISNAHSLFDFKWSDHILNEMSWLRADTYSWHNGLLYKAAYNHLASDVLTGGIAKTDYIEGIEIWYILGTDGHKIIDAGYQDQTHRLNAIEELYNKTGIAWYYVIDTVNKRFKLPRTKHGFTGLRDVVGKYISAGLPNITGSYAPNTNVTAFRESGVASGAFKKSSETYSGDYGVGYNSVGTSSRYLEFNASSSNSIYGNSTTVQPPATQMYLYFYVGEYSKSQAEQVATLDVEMFNNKADTDMLNLTDTGKNIANWSNNATNCVTEIPQDIKLELDNGTLTLKAGSKVYVPNGSGVFDAITTNADKTYSYTGDGKWYVFIAPNNGNIDIRETSKVFSGDTAPTGISGWNIWYDTTNNYVKKTTDSGSTWTTGTSLPIAIITISGGAITSIDQVFNGFGYIGSTVFALPGVKGLIPNGRNEDGTLKNTEYTIGSVLTHTTFAQNVIAYLAINSSMVALAAKFVTTYREKENYVFDEYVQANANWSALGTIMTDANAKINGFNVNSVFHSLDWNDKGTIAGWGMPSHKYINLTLGATESSYQAPANGWFVLNKEATGGGQYVNMRNNSNGIQTGINSSGSAQHLCAVLPCLKGDSMVIGYSAAGTIHVFRFVYTEGESNVQSN